MYYHFFLKKLVISRWLFAMFFFTRFATFKSALKTFFRFSIFSLINL
ncbi:hypothetical protein PBCV1_a188bR [Paramecium bursaria Chlorella virus 1]|uniref:Uncharacterized protein n=1 Tax=Paramecium bursaria Chlorella virus 1 TaxID=10506 RepID=F8TTZ3_PBCV1|nr:hypothetical protein PBCV1_a188bR [Paramecium bursaria Chlorella virus 1]AEI70054.1 hypothetical protein [Paramecium bursaria Chlorella virus 1]